MITPEILKEMIVIEPIAQFIANTIRAIAPLLLPVGTSVATALGKIGPIVTSILNTCRLAIATVTSAVLLTSPCGAIAELSRSISYASGP